MHVHWIMQYCEQIYKTDRIKHISLAFFVGNWRNWFIPKIEKKLLLRNLFNVLLRKVKCRCTILTFIFVFTKRTALSEHILIYILGNISNMRKRSGLYNTLPYPDRHYENRLLPTRVIPIKSLRLLETLITTSPSMPLNFNCLISLSIIIIMIHCYVWSDIWIHRKKNQSKFYLLNAKKEKKLDQQQQLGCRTLWTRRKQCI